MQLVKTSLRTLLKQTNLKNRLDISTEIPNEGFNDNVFQDFVYEFKHCKLDMQTDLQLVPLFLCLYSVYLFVMLPFRMVFFHNLFCFISFPPKFSIF